MWFDDALHLNGRLGVQGGSGTFSEMVPALTVDETAAQLCTTGEPTWQVQRLEGEGSLRTAEVRTLISSGSQGATRTVVTSEPPGTIRTVVTSEARTTAGTPRFRNYRGRTSQGEPMAVRTAKVDSTSELRRLDLASRLACEDGTEFGWAQAGGSAPVGRSLRLGSTTTTGKPARRCTSTVGSAHTTARGP